MGSGRASRYLFCYKKAPRQREETFRVECGISGRPQSFLLDVLRSCWGLCGDREDSDSLNHQQTVVTGEVRSERFGQKRFSAAMIAISMVGRFSSGAEELTFAREVESCHVTSFSNFHREKTNNKDGVPVAGEDVPDPNEAAGVCA